MSNPYARLDNFEDIITRLMKDETSEPLFFSLGEETAILSLLLRVSILPDLPVGVDGDVLMLCNKFADDIIRRFPYAEGYIDYLYGITALTRPGR